MRGPLFFSPSASPRKKKKLNPAPPSHRTQQRRAPPPAVHAKLTARVEQRAWRADTGQEFEDSLGNVLDRKTYEDLAKQGLL